MQIFALPWPDVTIQSTMTRSKPNAFNHLHQLKRKLKLCSREGMNLDSYHKEFADRFGLTPAESAATEVLVQLPNEVVMKLSRAAATYGMWRGPFSHQALGAGCWKHDFAFRCEDSWWHEQLNGMTSGKVPSMMAERLIQDWVSLPAGLRKTADADKVTDLFKCCKIFQVYMNELIKLIGNLEVNCDLHFLAWSVLLFLDVFECQAKRFFLLDYTEETISVKRRRHT